MFIYLYFWLHWVFVAACRLSLVAIHWLLTSVASLVAEHGLQSTQASAVAVHRLGWPVICGIFPSQGLNPCPLPWQVDSGQPDKSKKSYLSTTTESLDGYLKMGNSNYRTEIVFCKHECNKVS